jgi:hypothetical protein
MEASHAKCSCSTPFRRVVQPAAPQPGRGRAGRVARRRAACAWRRPERRAGAPGASSATAPATAAASAPDDTFLLTIFLRHDESKPLPKINDQLRAQGFFKTFPPPGIEVVSWYVMMGIGQVVTLRVPASRLREVNRAIETTAWGGYRTEFYPTYDYKAQAQQMRAADGK